MKDTHEPSRIVNPPVRREVAREGKPTAGRVNHIISRGVSGIILFSCVCLNAVAVLILLAYPFWTYKATEQWHGLAQLLGIVILPVVWAIGSIACFVLAVIGVIYSIGTSLATASQDTPRNRIAFLIRRTWFALLVAFLSMALPMGTIVVMSFVF
jgi:hypothetical protein